MASAVLFFSPLVSRAEPIVKSGESIAFLGDSITYFGAYMKDTPYFSTENPGGYVRLVASGLATQGINVTVIPAGIGGNNSKHMLGRLDKDVLSKKPTWMTLSAGVNDVMHKAVELEDYKTAVTAILDRAQQAGVKVVILTATQIGLPVTGAANVKLADYNASSAKPPKLAIFPSPMSTPLWSTNKRRSKRRESSERSRPTAFT
jgi:lysophospholipase L1-like esterase